MLKQASYMFAFILLALAVLVAVERTSSPFFQGCISENEKANGNTATKNDPTYGAVFTGYIRCSGRFIEAHGIGITALSGILVAAFTGTLWIATSRQSIITKEIWVADKRAFVFPTGINPFWELNPDEGFYYWRIRPVWQNSGETPTRRLRLYTDCEIRDTALPPNFQFVDGPIPPGAGMLGPHSSSMGGAAPLIPRPGISPQDILDAIASRKFIYLWGWVRYYDVFPNTKEHVTRFCWQIMPVGDPHAFTPGQIPTAPGSLQFAYLHIGQGNCADDECG
jgi:hypothetical protein